VNTALIIMTVIAPLVPVAFWPARRIRERVGSLVVLAPIPALLTAVLVDDFALDLPWLLLGARWGMDLTGRVFLGFTGTLWLAAGVYARSYLKHDSARTRFDLFWCLTMSGNLGVIVAQDMVSFLLFFALMSLAAYGLITHDRKPDSIRAGRTYIGLAVFGEVLLFWAVALAALEKGDVFFDGLASELAKSNLRNVIVGLLLTGFSIKLGLMPLHFWLPLAHPAAPTPASAVLSGAIIKTGLLGLLRFVPFGAVAMHEWGGVCVLAGVISTLAGALIGLTQNNPKTVLAYSSVSQMGLIAIALGVGLMTPDAWPAITVAILLFAVHHAVAKASLFLGVGMPQAGTSFHWQRTCVTIGLVPAALALAGLPLTSGFVAKSGLKYAAAAAPGVWSSVLDWILPLTGVTTTLLVCRFLHLVWPSRRHSHGVLNATMAVPWAILAVGVLVGFLAVRFGAIVKPTWTTLAFGKVWGASWPILGGLIIVAWLRSHHSLRSQLEKVRIPAGDVTIPVDLAIWWFRRIWHGMVVRKIHQLGVRARQLRLQTLRRALDAVTNGLEDELTAGVLIGLLGLVMFLLIM